MHEESKHKNVAFSKSSYLFQILRNSCVGVARVIPVTMIDPPKSLRK